MSEEWNRLPLRHRLQPNRAKAIKAMKDKLCGYVDRQSLSSCGLPASHQGPCNFEGDLAPKSVPARIWIASKGTEKALVLSEAEGWEVHEVEKAGIYRPNINELRGVGEPETAEKADMPATQEGGLLATRSRRQIDGAALSDGDEKPECPVCFTTWGGCAHTAKTPNSLAVNSHEKWLRKLAAELQSPNPPTTSCIVHTVLQAANEIGHLDTQLTAELKRRQDDCNE